MKNIIDEDITIALNNTTNHIKTAEYIANSKCGICNRKIEYKKDYAWYQINKQNVCFFHESSYKNKIFLTCHRCHNFLIFFDTIRFLLMRFLMRL